jgi:dihydroorotate dehydrogenase (NAD+) catalytic subunit
MAETLNSFVDAIEINVSCPNVKEGCIAFGKSAASVRAVTEEVKSKFDKTVIVKLTPNVTSIVEIAIAAQDGGADAVSLINTLEGMAIDIETRKPILANVYGGYSGPGVKPVALKMVYDTAHALSIPVIGMGGIENGNDAVEFLLAGAKAVMVGSANFVNPTACIDVANGIVSYMERKKFPDMKSFNI